MQQKALSLRYLVESARALGLEVIDRCNLTVLLEPGQEHLAQFLADNKVKTLSPPPASPPCAGKCIYLSEPSALFYCIMQHAQSHTYGRMGMYAYWCEADDGMQLLHLLLMFALMQRLFQYHLLLDPAGFALLSTAYALCHNRPHLSVLQSLAA